MTLNFSLGWYFGKTAGLWGTINNEPSDDFLTSSRIKARSEDLQLFTNSWSLNKCFSSIVNETRQKSTKIERLCDEFFISKLSSLNTCFSRISTEPFLSMCLNSDSEEEACSSALAYISLCSHSNTPLRVPDVCVKCNLPSGTQLSEGQFIQLDGPNLTQSTDVVFIIEAKNCNANFKTHRNFEALVQMLHKELAASGLTNNRYAAVVFGGNGVFDDPRSVVLNNAVFTDERQIISYFDSIPTGELQIQV